MSRKTEDKVVASVMIYGAPDFTAAGRRQIAAWLRQQASYIAKKQVAAELGKVFKARYFAPR